MGDPQGAPTSRPPELVYVSFAAEINPITTEALIAVMAEQARAGVRQVYLLLATPGGLTMNGLTLYNVLRGIPFELTTHNVGNVDSIGNVVFLAGRKRYACPQATFMFHGVGINIRKDDRLEQKALQEGLDHILSDQRRIGSIIAERTRLSEAEIEDLFREARTKDADYALNHGLIEEIRDVNLLPGAPVIAPIFQR